MKILLKFSILIFLTLNLNCSESSVKQFVVDIKSEKGTFIGLISSMNSTSMKPPYYIIPIVPEDKAQFNDDIYVDLDNGKIFTNFEKNSARKQFYKFSALSINEGLDLVINIILLKHENDDNSISTNRTISTPQAIPINKNPIDLNEINANPNEAKLLNEICFNLNQSLDFIKLFNLKEIESICIDFESNNCTDDNEHDLHGIILIECNRKLRKRNLLLLNFKNIENLPIIDTFETLLTQFGTFKRNSEKNCANNEKKLIDLNLTKLNFYHDNKIEFKNVKFNNYLSNFSKENVVILVWSNNDTKKCSILNKPNFHLNSSIDNFNSLNSQINQLGQNFKFFILISIVSILLLLITLYAMFILIKRNHSSSNTTQKDTSNSLNNDRFSYGCSSSTNLTSKRNDDEQFSIDPSLFSNNFINSSQLGTLHTLTDNANSRVTICEHSSNTLKLDYATDMNQRIKQNSLFAYSDGYLNEMGINMMDNLRSIVRDETQLAPLTVNFSQNPQACDKVCDTTQMPLSATSHLLKISKQNLTNTFDYMDLCVNRWCNLLDWKPEYNSLSNVLDDLIQLNDAKKN